MNGSLPSRFRRPRVLIVGCGDVGLRVARALAPRCRVLALTSHAERVPLLRAAGVCPLRGDLDRAGTLHRLGGLAPRVVHLAPPPSQGMADARTGHLLAALARRGRVRGLVYGSTTGVYGDRGGAWTGETTPVRPQTDRARRRVDAEARLRWFGRASAARVCVLRIPGIYAGDREGGHPRERLLQRMPVLQPQEDVHTNHIHADDLARACIAALWRGRPQRVYHASDDTELAMGDYFDLAADLLGLPRPARISRAQAQQQLSALRLSFMSESRRLHNDRLKRELRVKLRYPTVREGLLAG